MVVLNQTGLMGEPERTPASEQKAEGSK